MEEVENLSSPCRLTVRGAKLNLVHTPHSEITTIQIIPIYEKREVRGHSFRAIDLTCGMCRLVPLVTVSLQFTRVNTIGCNCISSRQGKRLPVILQAIIDTQYWPTIC